MSTVKIKTEPTTATTAVDVQVKLEPSLSTADIKLEQYSSDIDTKVKSDSEADIKSENDDEEEDTGQNKRQFICKHPGCDRSFNSDSGLSMHQFEHKLQVERLLYGKSYTFTRQSLDDRWPCPIPNCKVTFITANSASVHVRKTHINITKPQQQQQQQPKTKKARNKQYFLNVDDFYVNGVRCGYQNALELLICHECRLVPECLLTHLQQKHAFDAKSIGSSVLLESAVTANVDLNINQHISNPLLASAIRNPYQWQHEDIVQGWLCVTSDCGYSGYSSKQNHKESMHHGEQLTTVPALVLRLVHAKTQSSSFLITRIDQVVTSSNKADQHQPDYSHNGLNVKDESEDDVKQHKITETPKNQRRWICEYSGCGRSYKTSSDLGMHRHEHKLQTELYIYGKTYTLIRQSLDDRWSCPVSDCKITCKIVDGLRKHLRVDHGNTAKQQQQQQQQQQPPTQLARPKLYFLDVDDFYVNDICCGYHNTTGLLICQECRLVPECLLTHLQQNHGYDEKSIDNATLPESTRITGSTNLNVNQHLSNSYLTAAISQSDRQQLHQDIVHGWQCLTSDCGYCGYSTSYKSHHKHRSHQSEQITTTPALVLRLVYAKAHTSYFLITRLDTTSNKSNNIDRANLSGKHHRIDDDDADYDDNNNEEDNDSSNQHQTIDTSRQDQQWKCEYPGCERSFRNFSQKSFHQSEHKTTIETYIAGKTFSLSRPSLSDRWSCPMAKCASTAKTLESLRCHIYSTHRDVINHSIMEGSNQQQQQPPAKRKRVENDYVNTDDFYVNDTRCGYNNTTGVFLCYGCRLVPECLLIHIQQKHGYDGKSIDSAILPENARNMGSDPNINQHTSNPHLASAISQPYRWWNTDIVRGWLCTAAGCGYGHFRAEMRFRHRNEKHIDSHPATVSALFLRLVFSKTHSKCFLITRLDTASSNVNSSNPTNQCNNERDDDDDDDGNELVLSDMGDDSDDELVLSDYSGEDDIV